MWNGVTLLVIVFSAVICVNAQLPNLLGTPVQECLNCLCHARTGCWNRLTCASYSITKEYWQRAGSPVLTADEDPSLDESYVKCMNDENCILNTVNIYTESFGQRDCNCDGFFDCKDRLALHIFGDKCENPVYGAARATRFNECAGKVGVSSMSEAEEFCDVEIFKK